MIKNDRQYRITKAQAARFEKALADVSSDADPGIHSRIREAQRSALMSQFEDLRGELTEYEMLKDGQVDRFQVDSLSGLPEALIKARIARGMTQRELANQLGLKEQQIQRYEATDYAAANIARLQEVASALSVGLSQDIVVREPLPAARELFKRLRTAGLDNRFILSRLLPRSLAVRLEQQLDSEPTDTHVAQAANVLSRIFGSKILANSPLGPDLAVAGQARFKMAARAHEGRMFSYAVYAHYLATLVAEASTHLPLETPPTNWKDVRGAILDKYGEMSFRSGVRYAWDVGIPVLPLADSGVFDAAAWRIEHRNVIVLKQRVRSQARWLFDFLHEFFHVSSDPNNPQLAIVDFEDSLQERRSLPEEEEAHDFAGNTILGGRAEELIQMCVDFSGGRVERLKMAVQRVATVESVPADVLANYLAFRLSLQGINWWGAAANLQLPGADPFLIARDELLERLDLSRIDEIDRDLLSQALRGGEES